MYIEVQWNIRRSSKAIKDEIEIAPKNATKTLTTFVTV
jgi:hypothetical protein